MPRDLAGPFADGPESDDRDAAAGPIKSLKLEFSKAAHYNAIDALFDPAVKGPADPNAYVLKRAEHAFSNAVNNGHAVTLSDVFGNVKTLVMAYHIYEDPQQATPSPDFIEIGTTLSLLAGFKSAALAICALTLKEWWENEPREIIAAEIEDHNRYSLNTYHGQLGWEKLTDEDQRRRIYDAHDDLLADPNDRGKGALPPAQRHHTWYVCAKNELPLMAQTILDYIDQGGLFNKYTGEFIAVDFSALEDAGMTRAWLEALADGETSRARLAPLSGPSPS